MLELGLEVAEQALTDLPWEALQVPGGLRVRWRRWAGARWCCTATWRCTGWWAGWATAPAHRVRGPLRLLVAIASPETGDAELLDYEAELARIVAAVEPARKRGEAYVRVLNEGSLAAINAALSEDPEGFHVLHLSCHARPGELLLETAGGQPDLVSAERLLEEGVPAGADLPMVVLSGCSTGLAARQERLHPDTAADRAGGPGGQRLKQDTARTRARRCWPASPPSWWPRVFRRCWRCRRRSPTGTPRRWAGSSTGGWPPTPPRIRCWRWPGPAGRPSGTGRACRRARRCAARRSGPPRR